MGDFINEWAANNGEKFNNGIFYGIISDVRNYKKSAPEKAISRQTMEMLLCPDTISQFFT